MTGEEAEGRSELEAGLTLEAVLEQPIPPRQKDEDEVEGQTLHSSGPFINPPVQSLARLSVCPSSVHPLMNASNH